MPSSFELPMGVIRENLLLMSGLADRNLSLALRSLTERNDLLADAVETEDTQLDSLEMEIDEQVVAYISTRGPVAGDCRFMLVASKISNNLERVADLAVTIARRSRKLNAGPDLEPAAEIPPMARLVQDMLRDSIRAFVDGNMPLTAEIISRDPQVDLINKNLEDQLETLMAEEPSSIPGALDLLVISRSVERIGDHAKNIAEEVYYLYQARDIRHQAYGK